nr:hypothetical protein [uncultured Desulfobulbus sp.]
MKDLCASIQRHHGQADFAPITRVDLLTLGKTLAINGEDPSPSIPCHEIVTQLFPRSAHNITAMCGKELQNGNLRLVYLLPDNRHILATITPPYTVFWATDNATDQATYGNGEGQEG